MLPDLVEKQGGLPSAPRRATEQPLYDANRDDMPYNKNNYPGFDAQDQYIGAYTPLDKIFESNEPVSANFESNEPVSANAMDTNWGGKKFSEKEVLQGKFDEDMRFTKYETAIPIPEESYQQNVDNILTNREKQIDILKPSKRTKKEIANRYGGHIMNNPENRAVIAAEKSEDANNNQ
jgi:hypothetical protein